MSEAYRLHRFHHVSDAKYDRLREENLLPLIDCLTEHDLKATDIDDLMVSEEVMNLHMHEVDLLEDRLGIIQNILPGDWLIDFSENDQKIILAKYKRYVHHPHRHLYIKHFGEASVVYEIDPTDLPEELRLVIREASHLETLPLSVSAKLDRYEDKLLAQAAADSKHCSETDSSSKTARQPKTYSKVTPQLLVKVRNQIIKRHSPPKNLSKQGYKLQIDSRIRTVFKPGMTYAELVVATLSLPAFNKPKANTTNPNKALDKQAWAIFSKLFPGQQPKKGQISAIRAEIIKKTKQDTMP